MKLMELSLSGAYSIEPERRHDARGYFARTFCVNEFAAHGLVISFVQTNTAFSLHKGLIRGMHYQAAPFQETKLVRCTRGAIFDVIVDLRESSETFNQWVGVELSAKNGKSLYIPKGFAHGYQVLEDHTEIFYMMDEFYHPEAAREFSPHSKMLENCWPLAD